MSKMKKRRSFRRILVRHHCSKCNSRIFPFDKYEDQTESPQKGMKQDKVLLYSHNSRSVEDRVAWCWHCKKFVRADRLTEPQILAMYIRRKGVSVREK